MRDPIPVYIHLLRATNVIDRDYARELDVATLARAARASTAHFARGFKQAFGETPHQYLPRRRIERTTELLRGTELSVTQVSVEVGFHSLGSFSTAFRELVGESPVPTSHRREAPKWAVFEKHRRTSRSSVAATATKEAHAGDEKLTHTTVWVLDQDEALRELATARRVQFERCLHRYVARAARQVETAAASSRTPERIVGSEVFA